jgi:hypothetical protein
VLQANLFYTTNQRGFVFYGKHKMATYGKEKIEPIGYRFKDFSFGRLNYIRRTADNIWVGLSWLWWAL